MTKAEVTLNPGNHHLTLKGDLIFPTISRLRDQGNALIAETQGEIVFDFQGVAQCDSSALALLTSWTRCARQSARLIRFINLPQKLKDIAGLSNLHKFLSIDEGEVFETIGQSSASLIAGAVA
jgi:anti-anti-sigma factor